MVTVRVSKLFSLQPANTTGNTTPIVVAKERRSHREAALRPGARFWKVSRAQDGVELASKRTSKDAVLQKVANNRNNKRVRQKSAQSRAEPKA